MNNTKQQKLSSTEHRCKTLWTPLQHIFTSHPMSFFSPFATTKRRDFCDSLWCPFVSLFLQHDVPENIHHNSPTMLWVTTRASSWLRSGRDNHGQPRRWHPWHHWRDRFRACAAGAACPLRARWLPSKVEGAPWRSGKGKKVRKRAAICFLSAAAPRSAKIEAKLIKRHTGLVLYTQKQRCSSSSSFIYP